MFDRDGHWSELFDGTGMMSKNRISDEKSRVAVVTEDDEDKRSDTLRLLFRDFSSKEIHFATGVSEASIKSYMAGGLPKTEACTPALKKVLEFLRVDVDEFWNEGIVTRTDDPAWELYCMFRRLEGSPEYEAAKIMLENLKEGAKRRSESR